MKCEYCDKEELEERMVVTYFVSGKGMCQNCYNIWWESRQNPIVYSRKKINRVYSDLDPYGEEEWDA